MKFANKFLFLLAACFLLTTCSSAQYKSVPPPMTLIEPPSNAAFNVKTNKFESEGGNFSISILENPTQTRDLGTELANKKGKDVGKMFIWQFEKTVYTLMYKNALDKDGNPLEPDGGDPKTQSDRDLEYLKTGMRRGIDNSNAKFISEKSISFKKFSGSEYRYTTPDGGKFIGRVLLIDGTGYQIVGAYIDDKDEKTVLEILDSFGLLKEKK